MGKLQLRDFQVDLSSGEAYRTLVAWLVFHVLGGHVMLPILCATFLFTRAQRHPVMINMCLTWVFTSAIACLLFYANKYHPNQPQLASPEPLCHAQAALMQHAVPPMIAVSAFSLIYHVWTTVRTTIQRQLPKSLAWLRPVRSALLISASYFAFAVFAVIGAAAVTSHPGDVSLVRRKLYCSVAHDSLSIAVALFTALVLLVTGYFEVRIVLTLRRNSVGQRDAGVEDSVERALLMRVIIFGIYICVGFVLSVISLFVSTVAPDMFIATVPVVIFVVFGCQEDVVAVWCFWRKWWTPSRPSPKGPRMKIEDDVES